MVILMGTIALMLSGATLKAQVGINTETPDPSAIIDVVSTEEGVLIPRMTSEEREAIVNPATGLEVFCTDDGEQSKYYYDGTSWIREISVAVYIQAQIFSFANATTTANTTPVLFNGCNMIFAAKDCNYAQRQDATTIKMLETGQYVIDLTAYTIRSTATTAANTSPVSGTIEFFVNGIKVTDSFASLGKFPQDNIRNAQSMFFSTIISLNANDILTLKYQKDGTAANNLSFNNVMLVIYK
ncbi:MAG: hypothetical protein FWD66_05205 [Paludibacter sp.]|nr:hypothetical protein [Paludibacter sp.]